MVLVGCGSSIHEASTKGNIEAVKQYLAAGVDVNAKDWLDQTPLRWSTLDARHQVAQINASDIGGILFLIALVLCPIIFFAGIIALIIWAIKKGKFSGKGGSYYGNSCSSDSSSSNSSSSCGSSCGGCGGGD
ncbi:MAG: ankyrin repeat domain-containing protein [Verrucomicrobiota bacterium]|nr:ankyrin repeat domain-containing protein [Verrucomicrobiota bacterium]MDP7048273.1 ankyrin repeat domain-containing protein [Verrucomicrobiota bacterium]